MLRLPHYRRSLASRVTLLTTMAVGVSVAVVAAAAYLTVRTQTVRALDHSLRQRATAAASAQVIDQVIRQGIPSMVFGAADVRIISVDANTGDVVSADQATNMHVSGLEFSVADGRRPYSARTVTVGNERYRMVAVPTDEHGRALVLAQSLAPTDEMLDRLGLVTLAFGLMGMLVAAFAGWGVARNGLRPVRRLTEATEEIARSGNLDPIPVEGVDEIARLSISFNAMLASLEAARDQQRQLVADAGHELRTPLTSLRTNLDLLAQAGGSDRLSPASRRELLDDVRAQIEEMTTLIGDLVELAREDPPAAVHELVDFPSVVEQALARVRRRAPGLTFEVTLEPWWVVGDGSALERAATNLLDNAAKWSPAGGTVLCRLSDGTLTVADEGPGIAATDLPQIFDRFYRARESRAMPGSGLGLAIVRAVADRHGGSVRAGAGPLGGAGFWFSVPGLAEEPHKPVPLDSGSTTSAV